MNNIEFNLKQSIIDVVNNQFNVSLKQDEVVIETPKDTTMGDYSTTVAMRLTKKLGKNPKEIAQTIVDHLVNSNIESATIAGPGFINFKIKTTALANIINEVMTLQEKFGENNIGNNEAINVEYISANPTGDLHLGHARGAAWGDSLTRILKKSGYNVIREFYMNDSGNQVNNLGKSLASRYGELFGKNISLPEDGYHGEDIINIAKIIKEKYGDCFLDKLHENDTITQLSELGVYYEMEKMREDLALFRVEFDVFGSEDNLRKLGVVDEMYRKLIASGHTYELDGATFFKTTTFGDDKDRVIKKSDGSYTYLMPDIAYHQAKLTGNYNRIKSNEYAEIASQPVTTMIDLLGGDHHGYIARLKASLSAFGYNSDNLEIDIIQMVRLIDEHGSEIKMSKREGNAIKLRDFCNEVGVDAVRYFYVSRALETPFDFDVTLAKKQTNDNPVFYIQYAYARICSILKDQAFKAQSEYLLLTDEKEIQLLKSINEFSDTVASVAKERAVHKLCNYIYKLAQQFHSFYATCKVVDACNPDLTAERIALLFAIKVTLKNALYLIGVEAKEKM